MTLTETEITGFAMNVERLIEKAREDMEERGMDPERILRMLRDLIRETAETRANRDAAKRAAVELTARHAALKRLLYIRASGNLDMAIASVDKNSDAAANFRLLRSRIRRPAEPPEAEADGQDRDDESPPLKDETPPPGA
ncbi:MAG TPA: hypothetical protein VJ397_00490 [Thermoplasmata archaeon]|nr:hypothetical protein [Thermoplasmata archaeon]